VLYNQFVHIPHDALIPGANALDDLPALAASLAPLPLRMEGLVEGLNRTVADDVIGLVSYRQVVVSYEDAGHADAFRATRARSSPAQALASALNP
jgi:hypothetical protein